MSISTNSDGSDQEPSTLPGLRSPVYGTATFATLSPASSATPLSSTAISSTRLSVPSRSATPGSSADGSYTRHTTSSYDLRSNTDSRSYTDSRAYSDSHSESYGSYIDENDNDNSIDETAEVEEALSRIDDDSSQSASFVSQSARESDAMSSSGYSSAIGGAKTNTSSDSRTYVSASSSSVGEPLNFDHERRALSSISERTDLNPPSLISGTASTGLFQNIFSSAFASRPTSIFSARPFYNSGSASSGASLSPPPSIPSLQSRSFARPATPERHFKPAPPMGRRVGNLVASFESDTSITRPGSAPIDLRSPGSYGSSSRSTSPVKYSHSRSGSSSVSGSGSSISGYGHTQSQSVSSYLSPQSVTVSSLSRTTMSNSNSGSNTITAGSSSETERPRSPLTSVRNIVTAWKDRSPERLSARTAGSSYVSSASSASSRSTALQSQTQISQSSVASGPSFTSTSASSIGLGFGFGDNFLSLRRRAAASSISRDTGSESMASRDDSKSATGSEATGSDINTNTRSLGRTDSVKSSSTGAGTSVFDLSELDSFVRGGQEPLRIGQLWYLNVHAPPPYRWQRCQAVLYSSTLLLSWIASNGGRGVVTLDLVHCTEVRSVPSPSQPSARDDIGSIAARLQMGGSTSTNGYDLVEMLCPFQLLYIDGVERLGAESARERVRWVSAIWEALDNSAGPPERSMTRSPAGSVRTTRSSRSATSSVVSTNSGSGSTNYIPPSEFDATTLTRSTRSSLSPRNSLSGASSYNSYSRTRSADDSVVSSRSDGTNGGLFVGGLFGGLLHPFGIGAAPSRSSSLRRTTSLADLDQEYASALSAGGVSYDSRSRSGTESGFTSSMASSRWTRSSAPSDAGASSVGPSESASNPPRPRARASTLYNTSTREVTRDSHSGPTTTEEARVTTSNSNTGLSRQSAVRRRTPRAVRSYSESASGRGSEDIEYTESSEAPPYEQSISSSLQESFTTTSYDISDHYYERLHSSALTPSVSEESTIQARQQRPKMVTTPRKVVTPVAPVAPVTPVAPVAPVTPVTPKRVKSESEIDDIFLTPTASRPATDYHSVIGTPTPSSVSLPSEYDTAFGASKAPTEYHTAILCKSEKASSVYTTCDLCPSTPPVSVTEFYTAECRCKSEKAKSVSSLSKTASLYEPSIVPTIPSTKEVEIPLPGSVSEESLLKSVVELEKTPTASAIDPTTPSSVSSVPISSTIMKDGTPQPSSLTESSHLAPEPKTPSKTSTRLTTPSSPSYLETYKTESSLTTPKSGMRYAPSQMSVKESEPSLSDYESSVFLPSPSVYSLPFQDPVDVSFETSFLRPVSDLYESLAPSPFMPKGIVGLTEVPQPSSVKKAISTYSSTETPVSTTVGTESSLSSTIIPTPSSELSGSEPITRSYVSLEPPTPSIVSTPSMVSTPGLVSTPASLGVPGSITSSLTKSSALRVPSVPGTRSVTVSIGSASPSSGVRSIRSSTASDGRTPTASFGALTPSSASRSIQVPTVSEDRSAMISIGALTPSSGLRSIHAPTISERRSPTASLGALTPSSAPHSVQTPTVSEARSTRISIGDLTPSSVLRSIQAPTASDGRSPMVSLGALTPSSVLRSVPSVLEDRSAMISIGALTPSSGLRSIHAPTVSERRSPTASLGALTPSSAPRSMQTASDARSAMVSIGAFTPSSIPRSIRTPTASEARSATVSIGTLTPSSTPRSMRAPTASDALSTTGSISALTPSSVLRSIQAPTVSDRRSPTASFSALTPSSAPCSVHTPIARSATASIGPITPSSAPRSIGAPTVSEARSATISIGELTPSGTTRSLSVADVTRARTASPSSLTETSSLPEFDRRTMMSAPYTAVSSLTASSPFGEDITLGSTVTVSRTPSSISDVSTTSYSSSLFAPTILEEEEAEEHFSSPATMPTLLSSRSTTPRPMTPASIPLPSTPSLGSSTSSPSTETESLSTPRTEAHSLHTETSVATSSILEAPREEILTHDVNRLLRYLHDLDQIRGGETEDMKGHLQRIEDELRDLSDYLRQPRSPKVQVVYATPQPQQQPQALPQPQYIPQYQPQPAPVARTPVRTPVEYRNIPPAAPTPPVDRGSVTPRTAAQGIATPRPITEAQKTVSGSSSSPLPVPEPHPREVRDAQSTPPSSLTPSIRTITPPPPSQQAGALSPTPSISSITDEGTVYLTSHHSDDFSLMSLEDHPVAPPISPLGVRAWASDSGSGLSVSSSEAPWPPTSVTPSSDSRSSMVGEEDIISLKSVSIPISIPISAPSSLASIPPSLASVQPSIPISLTSISPSITPIPPSIASAPVPIPAPATVSGSLLGSVPASLPRSLPESEYVAADLTSESPLPLPSQAFRDVGSPLPSIVSVESPLPLPSMSSTPSLEDIATPQTVTPQTATPQLATPQIPTPQIATPQSVSPVSHAPFPSTSPLPSSTPREPSFMSESTPGYPPSSSDPSSSSSSSTVPGPPSIHMRQPVSPVLSMSEVESVHEVSEAVYESRAILSVETTPVSVASPLPIPPGMLEGTPQVISEQPGSIQLSGDEFSELGDEGLGGELYPREHFADTISPLTEESPLPMPTPEIIRMPEPEPMLEPTPEPQYSIPMPEPLLAPPAPLVTESDLSLSPLPSPPISIVTARQPSEDSRARIVDGLRDLLEDLRGQTQALWDGQLSTNRMLDDLIARRPSSVHPPVQTPDEELNNRLRNIEGLLNNIMRDLTRGGIPPSEEEPSEISSDTSSALRRYVDRLRDRRQEPLHMPTPVRAPPPNLDSEWLEFLAEPAPSHLADQAIQGPPPLEPLYRRPVQPRVESISLPPSLPSPTIRTRSAPLDESVVEYDLPGGRYDVRRRPFIWPRITRIIRRPRTISEVGSMYEPAVPPEMPRVEQIPGPHTPRVTDAGPDIDFFDEVLNRRRQAHPGTDGFIDTTIPPDQITLDPVPPAPGPRPITAPPTGHVSDPWYTPVHQTLGDPSHGRIAPTPSTPLPQPIREEATPVPSGVQGVPVLGPGSVPGGVPGGIPGGIPGGVPGGVPIGIPMGFPMAPGGPPPFNEMLDILRQNRLAQTASIDQQREIMRYMRGLNSWLERDVRDRQNEMKGIGARVDALRQELARLGLQPAPLQTPAQGQPPSGQPQTFIVPPYPQVQQPPLQSGTGVPVIPSTGMPQPMIPISPYPAVSGTGPSVYPPYEESGDYYVPPHPPMRVPVEGPVIPQPPVTTMGRYEEPPLSYGDVSTPSEPFIPPRYPSGIPVPPPVLPGPGGQIAVIPPSEPPSESSSSSSSRTPSPARQQSVHVYVPSSQQTQPQPIVQPVVQPQPQVISVQPPIHPGVPDVQRVPTTHIPTPPREPPQPIYVIPPPESRSHFSPPPHIDRPISRSEDQHQVIMVPSSHPRTHIRSRSSSPTRIVVRPGPIGAHEDISDGSDLDRVYRPPRHPRRSPRRDSRRRDSRTPPAYDRRRDESRRRPSRSSSREGRGRDSSVPATVIVQTQAPSHVPSTGPYPVPPMEALPPPPVGLAFPQPPIQTGIPIQPGQAPILIAPQVSPGSRTPSSSRSRSSSSGRTRTPTRVYNVPQTHIPSQPQQQIQPIIISQPSPQPPIPPSTQPPYPQDGSHYTPAPTIHYFPSGPPTHTVAPSHAPTSFPDPSRTPRRSRSPDHPRTPRHDRSRSPVHSRTPRHGRSRSPVRSRTPRDHSRIRDRSRTPPHDRSRSQDRTSEHDGGRRGSPVSHGGRRGRSERRGQAPSRGPSERHGESRTHTPPTEREGSPRHPRRPIQEYGDPTGGGHPSSRRSSPLHRDPRSLSPRTRSRADYDAGFRRGLEEAALRHAQIQAQPLPPSPRPVTTIDVGPGYDEQTPATIVHTLPAPGIQTRPEPTPSVIRVPSRPQPPEISEPETTYVTAPGPVYAEAGRASPGSPTRVVVTPGRPTSVSTVYIRPSLPPEPPSVTHVITSSPVIHHGPSTYPPPAHTPPPSQPPPSQLPPTQFPPSQPPPIQLPPTQFPPTQFPPTQFPPTQLPSSQFPPTQFPPSTHPSRPPTVVPSGYTHPSATGSSFIESEEAYDGPVEVQPELPVAHFPLPTHTPTLESQIRDSRVAESQPIIPVEYPVEFEPVPGVTRLDQPHVPSHVPTHVPTHPTAQPVRMHEPPQTPSGPGNLDYEDDLDARRQRLEEQELHLQDMQLAAEEAEDRREQEYRDREEERQRIFLENEERREREVAELRNELERIKSGVHHVPPPAESVSPPIEAEPLPEHTPEHIPEPLPESIPEHITGSELESRPTESFVIHDGSSVSDSMRPVPPPVQPIVTAELPQLQEILTMLRTQQAEAEAAKEQENQRFEEFRLEIQEARAEAKEECEERIRFLEEELARTRAELENEREQRRLEEMDRFDRLERDRNEALEREHNEAMERDEAVRGQLSDITNLLYQQQEQIEQKRALMEDRWNEKESRRAEKQMRSDDVYQMLDRILQEREQERIERENEKGARPNIEDVLEALQRQNNQQIQMINELTEAWRMDSSRQHQDTLDAVRATAQEMVPYNLTGYLDEFSKALAGEIRTLLGEVGRLHEQKRTLQFEISSLLHMHSQYGPGGQFEPDWHPPSMGPLAGPPPGDPGLPPPPPGPDEPPPPAKPAWRTVQQQRTTRRKRAAKQEPPPPQPTSLVPEPIHPSWATWQPNPAFAPTPPPGPSPLVVPPSGPAGLFGPRSPRGAMY